MRVILITAAMLCGSGSLATAADAALFQNGSFEAGTFVDNGARAEQLPIGSTAITGWTVIGGSDIAWEQNGNPYGVVAANGSFALDLTGYSDRTPYGGVRQTFDTIAGHNYSLSYDVGNTSATGSTISAAINGVTLLSFTNTVSPMGATVWRTAAGAFTATGSSTQLDLLGVAGGDAINLDNVRVVDLTGGAGAAPEPASWAMMIAGFGAIGTALRRRKAAVSLAWAADATI